MARRVLAVLAMLTVVGSLAAPAWATSDSKSLTLPGGQGTITSNAWRTTGNGSISGNTRQWEYQVSAVYSGTKTVQRIRATWWAGAALRTSASLNLGLSNSGVTVGSSSTWTHVTTPEKYWENTNGAKSSSWRTNMFVAPEQHYLSNTIWIANRALVKVSTDARTFEITASA